MEEPIAQQFAIGAALIFLGLAGWLLPYEWNILKLKRFAARHLSEETQRRVPKIVGTVCLLAGVAILIATATIGEFS
jgi:hypothetical protein